MGTLLFEKGAARVRQKRIVALAAALAVVVVLGGWGFARGVSRELWESALGMVMESSRQGAENLGYQIENDYTVMEQLWESIRDTESLEDALALGEGSEGGILLFPTGGKTIAGIGERDQVVEDFLQTATEEKGIFGPYINSVIGEEMFSLYRKGSLVDGSQAYLVKEYRTREIAEHFTLSFYGGTGLSYLVDQSGAIMVQPFGQEAGEASLFDLISQEKNDSQAIARLRENLAGLKSDWARLWCGEAVGNVVFCYQPLPGESGWILVSAVPEREMMAQAKRILARTLLFSGLAIVIILAAVLMLCGSKLRENRQRTQEVEWALAVAGKANRVKGRFLMDISHDIRTPLNAIVGMTTIAKENLENPPKLADCLEKISISSAHLLTLISDVLDMSQIEQGKAILIREPVELDQLYGEITNLMERRAQEAGLALRAEPARLEDRCVWGDPQRIRQILMNVIGNAIKYTPAGGSVVIELTQLTQEEKERHTYCFRCKDTGIGMEEEFIEKVFLPFERARNTTDSKIPGVGVGLSITKSLVDLMGGEIWAESVLGKGSVFTVTLPLKAREEEPAPQEEPVLRESPDYSAKRVLIVEDNELNMEILEELLTMTGVQTGKAYDGQEAVELVKNQPEGYYDLIFMDIQMPVMDGYSATRLIRSLGREDTARVPIYAVSANALAQDVANALEAGMNGHIAKPVDLETLGKVLKHCLA